MADTFSIAKDSSNHPAAVPINVLGNDNDPDNDPLTITGKTDPPSPHGSVAISADGKSMTYTPKKDDTGTYDFTYTISDGKGGTATATVTVSIN